MAEEFFGDRRRALEEEFFRKQENTLLNQLRTAQAKESAQEALAATTGVPTAIASMRTRPKGSGRLEV